MNRKAWVLIGVVFLMGMATVDARLPAVDDTVIVKTAAGESTRTICGNVTDISDGFICLKVLGFMLEKPSDGPDDIIVFDAAENDTDVCVGIGTIRLLEFRDYQKMKETIEILEDLTSQT